MEQRGSSRHGRGGRRAEGRRMPESRKGEGGGHGAGKAERKRQEEESGEGRNAAEVIRKAGTQEREGSAEEGNGQGQKGEQAVANQEMHEQGGRRNDRSDPTNCVCARRSLPRNAGAWRIAPPPRIKTRPTHFFLTWDA
eukprot:9483341-Pyramimonas_sp.AAC.1